MPTSAKSGARYSTTRSTDFVEVHTISGSPPHRDLGNAILLSNYS
jgi:hypothetical protein